MLTGLYRRVPLPVTGALALLTALAVCPSASRAACGDYVTVVADSHGTPAPTPTCHGCSHAPTRAAPVTTPKLVERPSPDGVVTAAPAPPATADAGRTRPSSAAPIGARPSDIFHPPRA